MSGVFQNIDPPPPHRPERGEESGWGGVNILEDARHCSVLYILKCFVGFPYFPVRHQRPFTIIKCIQNIYVTNAKAFCASVY
jgi:hypothetical protein